MEAWSLIIRDAQNRNIDDSRPIFEKLVDTFSTTGKFWKMYIEQEVSVIALFSSYEMFLNTLALMLSYISTPKKNYLF